MATKRRHTAPRAASMPRWSAAVASLAFVLLAPRAARGESTHALLLQVPRALDGVLDLSYARTLGPLAVVGIAAAGTQSSRFGASGWQAGLGAQGLWPLLGSVARGLHAGIELRWERRSLTIDNSTFQQPAPADHSTSDGWHLGALGGARWTLGGGLTVQGQIGLRWRASRTTWACCGTSGQDDASGWAHLAYVAVGYAW